MVIESLETGEVWYEHQADKMFNPASNNKIITTASALLSLGPDYHFKNIMLGDGILSDSVYQGNIILWSNGDPTLYNKFYEDPRTEFFRWADSLKTMGIKNIEGNILADPSAFDNNIYGSGWAWDDVDYDYNAEISALQLNENYIDIEIVAPKDTLTNDSTKIELIPSVISTYYTLHNEISLIDSGKNKLSHHRIPETNNITLSGELLKGSDTLITASTLHNPPLFYAHVFKEVLQESGINVNGIATIFENAESKKTINKTYDTLLVSLSPAFPEILSGLMKRSQNLYAETMVKAMGYELKGFGSFDSGRAVVYDRLAEMGLDKNTIYYRDGSGLSRYNYVSPRQFLSILKYMDSHEYSKIWHNIQGIAAVDGTLEGRMKNTAAAGNVHGKTGTLTSVRGLSGYVTTADGEKLVFSFLINGHLKNSSETNFITDRVLVLLANLDRPFR